MNEHDALYIEKYIDIYEALRNSQRFEDAVNADKDLPKVTAIAAAAILRAGYNAPEPVE